MQNNAGVGFSSPATRAAALTVGNPAVAAGRAVFIDCTVGGNAVIALQDASTITVNLQANTVYQFNWAVTGIASATATATFTNLY